MKKVSRFIRPFAGIIAVGILLKAVGSFADLFLPYLLSFIIDDGIGTQNTQLIIQMCSLMLVISLISLGSNLTGHYIASKISTLVGKNIREEVYRHIQTVSCQNLDRFSTASIVTRVTSDVEQIQRFVSMTMRMLVRQPLLVIGGVVMSLMIDPYLTLVIFVSMGVILLISMKLFRLTRPIYQKVQENIDKLTAILRENLSGIKVIKSFDKGEHEWKRFRRQSDQVRKTEILAGKYNAFISPSITVFTNLAIVLILLVSGYRVSEGYLEIGKVVTVVNYINMILNGMMTVPRIFMMVSRSGASGSRIGELLELPSEPTPVYTPCLSELAGPAADGQPVIQFEDVTFTYPGAAHPSVEKVSFSIKKGETTAVIGPTGCGKTTLVYLLTRLYRPQEGAIYLYGKDLSLYSREFLRSHLSAALQQYAIFSMTAGENISIGMEADADKLRQAARTAQLLDFIDSQPQGFDTHVSQAGTTLSGGQKQRINIARTFYRDTDVVILDDVSSALDYKTDLNLRRALRESSRGRTVFMIAQRVNSIRDADQILVMESGRIAASGRHEQLLKQSSLYQAIYQTQSGGLIYE